jgi:Kef-type K+ transport system membrane component KefB
LQIGGALIGPHALNIISDVHAVQHLAELGVVFLLFNIGLELSLERLQSMAKYVFGMGAAQVRIVLLWCCAVGGACRPASSIVVS